MRRLPEPFHPENLLERGKADNDFPRRIPLSPALRRDAAAPSCAAGRRRILRGDRLGDQCKDDQSHESLRQG